MLRIVNKKNSHDRRLATFPMMNVHCSGIIIFNSMAIELLNLKVGTLIEFANDEDEKNDWYIYVVQQDGFKLRHRRSKFPTLMFQSKTLSDFLLNTEKFKQINALSAKFRISNERTTKNGIDMFPILTAIPIISENRNVLIKTA